MKYFGCFYSNNIVVELGGLINKQKIQQDGIFLIQFLFFDLELMHNFSTELGKIIFA